MKEIKITTNPLTVNIWVYVLQYLPLLTPGGVGDGSEITLWILFCNNLSQPRVYYVIKN